MTTNLFQLPIETVQDADAAIDALLYYKSQFAALAPDWSQAPEWAQWYTIDYQGAFWWQYEPESDSFRYWNRIKLSTGEVEYGKWDFDYFAAPPSIPLGIDWRLCKWQRPEAQP